MGQQHWKTIGEVELGTRSCLARTVSAGVVLVTVLVLVFGFATTGMAQERPGGQFSAEMEVTAVHLAVVATDGDGRPVTDLAPEEIRVLEDGVPVRLLSFGPALSSPGPAGSGVEEPEPGAPVEERPEPVRPGPWRVVAYANPELSTRIELPRMLEALAAEASRLTELGPVDVVLASPDPEVVAGGIRDPEVLRAALLDVAASNTGHGTISELRGSFVRSMVGSSSGPTAGRRRNVNATLLQMRLRQAVGEELGKVRTEIGNLESWLQTQPPPEHGLLLLAMGGVDIDPVAFYLSTLAQQSVDAAASLRSEFASINLAGELRRLMDVAVAHGWTVVPLNAARSDAFLFGADVSGDSKWQHFVNPSVNSVFAQTSEVATLQPMQSLEILAEVSGGEVVRKPSLLPEALDRLEGAYLVAYQAARANDGRRRKLEIRCARQGVQVRTRTEVAAGTPVGVAESRGLRLLAGDDVGSGGLPVTVEVVGLERDGRKRLRGELRVTATVAELQDIVARAGGGRMRVSVVVHPEGTVPFTSHEEAPLVASSSVAVWTHTAPMVIPKDLKRIAVVVEELVTGAWNAKVVELR